MSFFNCQTKGGLRLSASMTSDIMGLSNGKDFDWLPLEGESPLFEKRGLNRLVFQKEAKDCLFEKLAELSENGAGEEDPFSTYQAAEHFIHPKIWGEWVAKKRADQHKKNRTQ